MREEVYNQILGPGLSKSQIEEFDNNVFQLISVLVEIDKDLKVNYENN